MGVSDTEAGDNAADSGDANVGVSVGGARASGVASEGGGWVCWWKKEKTEQKERCGKMNCPAAGQRGRKVSETETAKTKVTSAITTPPLSQPFSRTLHGLRLRGRFSGLLHSCGHPR